MSELAERSGVGAATIKHYLREGLLGSEERIVKTSRNMAWYPPDFVDRLRVIKRLQEEKFLPLKVIREVLDQERLLEAAVRDRESLRIPRAAVEERLPATQEDIKDVRAELRSIGRRLAAIEERLDQAAAPAKKPAARKPAAKKRSSAKNS